MLYLYILYSPTKNKYYVGYSHDLVKRLGQHNDPPDKIATFTHKNGLWELKAAFKCGERGVLGNPDRILFKKTKKEEIDRADCFGRTPGWRAWGFDAGSVLSILIYGRFLIIGGQTLNIAFEILP